ncbi:MAG TPA: hypothetical protein VGA88_14570 [Burkholderiales bacterium]
MGSLSESVALETVKPTTLDALERWARWRVDGTSGTSGQYVGGGGDTLARLQEIKRCRICPQCQGLQRIGLRRCPTCHGVGTVAVGSALKEYHREVDCKMCRVIVDGEWRSIGEINGKTCWRCGGSGKRIEAARYVHPALIPGTRVYGRQESDPVSSLINYQVFQWLEADATFWMHHVLIAAYTPDPQGRRTNEAKASVMGLSPAFFSRTLKRARLAIQELVEKRF